VGQVSEFKFLTRVHYCARDVDTHGPDAEWGEHEMDYVLFIQATVDLSPHPEEVQDWRYVTQAELATMMLPDSGLSWSPWFRSIAASPQLLPRWWDDLQGTLRDGRYVDTQTIHRVL